MTSKPLKTVTVRLLVGSDPDDAPTMWTNDPYIAAGLLRRTRSQRVTVDSFDTARETLQMLDVGDIDVERAVGGAEYGLASVR